MLWSFTWATLNSTNNTTLDLMLSLGEDEEDGGGGWVRVDDRVQDAGDIGRLDCSGEPTATRTRVEVEADKA
jgi:hypothetical protein